MKRKLKIIIPILIAAILLTAGSILLIRHNKVVTAQNQIKVLQAESITAEKLNKIENGIDMLDKKKIWEDSQYRSKFELIAHRGFGGLYPENTIYAAQSAIKEGASPECDVSITSDGYPVLMHDRTVDRTTNGTGTITALTWAYVSGLDAGSKFSPDYAGLHVPLFVDYLKACKNANQLFVEIKNLRSGMEQTDVQSITQAIINEGLEDKVILQSFSYATHLPWIRAISKKIRVGCLVGGDQNAFNTLLPQVAADYNSMINIQNIIATEANAQACKQAEVDVGVWTVDTLNDMQLYFDRGYRKITSNYNLGVPKPLTADELTQMYSDADKFKGRTVDLYVKIFTDVEKDDKSTYIQGYHDPDNYTQNTLVRINDPKLDVKQNDIIHVIGIVDKKYDGKNAIGGNVSAPVITASKIEKSEYITAFSPAVKTIEVNKEQNQNGYVVKLNKIEIAKAETRVHVTVTNNMNAKTHFYSFNAKVVQGSSQIKEQYNFIANYPRMESDILPGVKEDGLLVFAPIDTSKGNLKIYLEGSSENYFVHFEPFTFEVPLN